MGTVLSIIAALLILTVFVFVHELGHYSVGRLFNFEIDEFALGMGPVIVKTTSKKTGIMYAVRAFPIGGMCRFYGEDEDVKTERVGFNEQKVWKRALVVLAGPVMNILFAFIFAVITLVSYGDYVPSINSFSAEDAPAVEAGLLPGDVITHIDGKRVTYFNQTATLIASADSAAVDIEVERDGEALTFTCRDIYDAEAGRNYIGIYMDAVRQSYTLGEAIDFSFSYIWGIICEMFSFLGKLFVPGAVSGDDVGGPVAIISLLSQAVRLGFETVLRLAVLISINLGIVNLLPLPALDGGRLVFMGIEAIRGKPVPQKIEGMVHLVGIILLFALIILLSVKDVIGLFGS